MHSELNADQRERAAKIVALFSCLVHEWLTGDGSAAEETARKLDHLGVQVKLCPCGGSEVRP